MANNDKFKVGRELKALVGFLASGAFAAPTTPVMVKVSLQHMLMR
ncbi:MAG: hypothetical protein OXC79_04965 [Candidatus Poribacteria bacterium]|nr:hypothetical protein [Candidatus Poribacteria bacterium]